MDRLDELRLFLAILDGGSQAAAGKRLGHSPPAVTRTLSALEERLGVRLMERSTRRSRPTEAGLRLAAQARRILAEYEAAMTEVAGEAAAPRGRLRIAAPLVFGRLHVAPLTAEFLASRPLVSVELVLSDRNADVVEEGIDVALRIGRLADTALIARKVGEVRMLTAASPAYLAARGTPAHPRDLAGHDLLDFSGPVGGTHEWRFAGPGGEIAQPIAPRFSVNAAEAAVDAAVAGRGIVRALSYQLAGALSDGRLLRLLPGFEPPPRPVSLLHPSARLLPARVRAFLDFAAPRLAALPVLRAEPPIDPPAPARAAAGRRARAS
jgi:DNA-binding transcriptional LysR family regulator